MSIDYKADDKCVNCWRDFADHNYVKDSIDKYMCPVPKQESGYGGFNGGDPRNFHPDMECCTLIEVEAHRRACEFWNEAEAKGETPEPEACPSGWIKLKDGTTAHVLRMPYGIGIYTWEEETYFELAERIEDDGQPSELTEWTDFDPDC